MNCPPGKILNPLTRRCVLKSGKIGSKIMKENDKNAENKNAENKNAENKNAENKNAENKNIENKKIPCRITRSKSKMSQIKENITRPIRSTKSTSKTRETPILSQVKGLKKQKEKTKLSQAKCPKKQSEKAKLSSIKSSEKLSSSKMSENKSDNKILNIETGRYVLKTGKIGKKIIRERQREKEKKGEKEKKKKEYGKYNVIYSERDKKEYGKYNVIYSERDKKESKNIKMMKMREKGNKGKEYKRIYTGESIYKMLLHIINENRNICGILPSKRENILFGSYSMEWICENGERILKKPQDFDRKVRECNEKTGRFIVIVLYLNYRKKCRERKEKITELKNNQHINVLIYDKMTNELERFEPLGEIEEDYYEVKDGKLDNKIMEALKGVITIDKYEKPIDYCPKISFQQKEILEKKAEIENLDENLCGYWSLWYLDLKLSNPDIIRKKLVEYAIDKFNTNNSLSKIIVKYRICDFKSIDNNPDIISHYPLSLFWRCINTNKYHKDQYPHKFSSK